MRVRRMERITVFCILLATAVASVAMWYAPSDDGDRKERLQPIITRMEGFYAHPPAGVDQQVWLRAVTATISATAEGVLRSRRRVSDPQLEEFIVALEQKSQSTVDMQTLFWIWMELAAASREAEQYLLPRWYKFVYTLPTDAARAAEKYQQSRATRP